MLNQAPEKMFFETLNIIFLKTKDTVRNSKVT